ncbi:MAG: riboflavin synthase [Capsulimonas sp.]|uniref:riboflavin synthase n=1 Tax=Capsulimonas sp. TaxID=2494211 RepID=UPI0032659954
MFTGIIEEVGKVAAIERGANSARFTIEAHDVLQDVRLGDSITVNGACLTVVAHTDATLEFDVVYETMQRTAFGDLAIDDQVNMERSLAANGRFDGHIVQGHVDGTGTIASIREVDNSYYVYIKPLPSLMRYIVRKGSIAVDGISLTVADVDDKMFSVAIIPFTMEHTNFGARRAGDVVNLETDIIGKYVERLVSGEHGRPEAPPRNVEKPWDDRSLMSTTATYQE